MFDYDIAGKNQMDQEIHRLINVFYRERGKEPVKINVSRKKMQEINSTLPSPHKHIVAFCGIPVETDEKQTEDYKLVAE